MLATCVYKERGLGLGLGLGVGDLFISIEEASIPGDDAIGEDGFHGWVNHTVIPWIGMRDGSAYTGGGGSSRAVEVVEGGCSQEVVCRTSPHGQCDADGLEFMPWV